jgi:GDP-L-fucose synthase
LRILLTGSTGMVGRNLLEHPGAAGHTILTPGRRELELTSGASVREWFTRNPVDLVIHAAGRVGGIAANIARPTDFLVRNIVLGARDAGVPQLLNLSSSCIYPRDRETPLTEEMVLSGELEPTNEGYALAKIATMRLCRYVRRERPELQYKSVIPCNLYGPHDKFDAVHAHLIPAVIAKVVGAAREGAKAIEIWGDGSARREFMYASDLADFIWSSLPRFEALPDDLNVGVGRDHTIKEYYQAVADVIGWRGEFTHDLSRPVGMKRKLMDVTRMEAFGWTPRTGLAEGIAATYTHFQRLSPT